MLDRHKHAIEENDMLNWLKEYEKLMTDDERNRYWDAVRQIVYASVELKYLYEAVKGRETL